MVRNYLDYAGLKRVIGKLFGIRRIWHGTAAEWEALTPAERDYYDQAEVIDAVYDQKLTHVSGSSAYTFGTAAPHSGFIYIDYSRRKVEQFSVKINGTEVIGHSAAVGYANPEEIHVNVAVSKGDIVTVIGTNVYVSGASWYAN